MALTWRNTGAGFMLEITGADGAALARQILTNDELVQVIDDLVGMIQASATGIEGPQVDAAGYLNVGGVAQDPRWRLANEALTGDPVLSLQSGAWRHYRFPQQEAREIHRLLGEILDAAERPTQAS